MIPDMNVQIKQIKSDIVELVFNPREVDLRVGENLSINEKGHNKGLIVQVIEFRTVTYPALLLEMLQLVSEDPQLKPPDLSALTEEGLPEMSNLKLAVAKIRKVVTESGRPNINVWENWDGWISTREVTVERTSDEEVFRNATRDLGNRIYLGTTLGGEDFFIEGQDLEKVNVVTGVKGAGKSHLTKVLLLQLIKQGAPCIVFDINREYIHLPKVDVDQETGQVKQKGIIHLEAGGNFRLGVRQFGLAPLMTLLQRFGLPEVSALYFENRIARLWSEAEAIEKSGRRAPYIGLEQVMQMAEENEFGGGSNSLVVNQAIRSRLEALSNTNIFARTPQEAASLGVTYRMIRHGGALIIDISSLSNLAREGFVQAIIEIIKDICLWEIEHETNRFPFIFFEEAHLYVSKHSIDYIVTRARHLGITSFFVTNMIHGLEESILRQADNLFLLRIPFDDDVRHVSRGAAADYESMMAFVRRLKQHHALAIGTVTAQYPLMFKVDPLEGINTAGETRYFFRERTETE